MDEKSTILLARSSFFPFFFYLIHDHIIGCVIDPFRARKLVIIRANKAHDIDPRARIRANSSGTRLPRYRLQIDF